MSTDDRARKARFRALYEEAYEPVLRFARRRTSREDADDVVAETFLVAWRRLDDVPRRDGESVPWLYAVARNCLRTAHRTGVRQHAVAVRISRDTTTTVGQSLPDIPGRVDLERAWSRLTDDEQEVLSLALWEELTSPEASRVLGISGAAYRMRLSRARRSLRAHLTRPVAAPIAYLSPVADRITYRLEED
jgi:RNA polymerase sigma-70 factor (ECF subfamily)